MTFRQVKHTVKGILTSDGAGVHLTRIIGTPQLIMHDPFLLLDEFKSSNPDDYIAGFPNHPHRGFETVTYMIEGKIRHKDNAGHEGVIGPGAVQWLTAGRGIIHSEFPEQENGLLWGLQLWINLSASEKRVKPRYQEFDKDSIPEEIREPGVMVKVISGTTSLKTKGPIKNIQSQQNFFIVELDKNTGFKEPIPADLNALLFVYDGVVSIESDRDKTLLSEGMLAVLNDGDELIMSTNEYSARCLLISALPLNEPVARGGPFVMNTKEEIIQASVDYESGVF